MTKLFKNDYSKTARIPSVFTYERSNLGIERIGDQIRIRPSSRRLNDVLAKFAQFSPDIMAQGRDIDTQTDRAAL